MSLSVEVYENGDHACLVWLPTDVKPIPDCRGFAIERTLNNGKPECLQNHVGFKDGQAAPAKGQEWKWPIQRYLWWDYAVKPGDKVKYRVIPVVGSSEQNTLKLVEAQASPSTKEINISGQDGRSFEAYFNRGIVATQWVAKELEAEERKQKVNKTMLQEVVAKPNDPLRNELSGLLRPRILDLMKKTKAEGGKVFAALYELNDPELIEALTELGPNCNLILANGAFKPHQDENAEVRAKLKKETKIHVFDRLVPSGHFGHNKILICCDKHGKAQHVLTGSTNWTITGLCTQANNGLIIHDPHVADAYLQLWNRLHQAGNVFPPALVKANSTQKTFTVDGFKVTPWFVPTDHAEDLQFARGLINQAKEGILFLFFNPGTFQEDPNHWTLLQSVLNRHNPESNPNYDPNLYIRGVVNQEIPKLTEEGAPAAKGQAQTHASHPSHQIHPSAQGHKGHKRHPALDPAFDPAHPVHPVALITGGVEPPLRLEEDVTVPANIKAKFGHWTPELLGASMVMIHSKVIVIDPFGEHPVLMTGSHNLGLKASSKNDDNLAIIEGNSALAQAYAVNIIAIYQEYRFRHYVTQHATDKNAWHGLDDHDNWQSHYLTGDAEAELKFWIGTGERAAPSGGQGHPKGARAAGHKK